MSNGHFTLGYNVHRTFYPDGHSTLIVVKYMEMCMCSSLRLSSPKDNDSVKRYSNKYIIMLCSWLSWFSQKYQSVLSGSMISCQLWCTSQGWNSSYWFSKRFKNHWFLDWRVAHTHLYHHQFYIIPCLHVKVSRQSMFFGRRFKNN
jgi:hypothetical protein